MREAKVVGSSSEKPEVSTEVSNRSQIKSLTVLSFLSSSARATECLNDGVAWVELHGLLGCHVARHGAVLEGLGLHDALHVGRPAVFASHQTARRGGETVRDNNLLCLVSKHLLDQLAQVLT